MGVCSSAKENKPKKHENEANYQIDANINKEDNKNNLQSEKEDNHDNHDSNNKGNLEEAESNKQKGIENENEEKPYYLICKKCQKSTINVNEIIKSKKENDNFYTVKYTCQCMESSDEEIEDSLDDLLTSEEPNNKCEDNNDFLWYCKTHGKIICDDYLSNEHKSCEINKTELCTTVNIDKVEKNIQSIKGNKNKLKDQIEKICKEFNSGIDEQINKLNEDDTETKENLITKNNYYLKEIEKIVKKYEKFLDYLLYINKQYKENESDLKKVPYFICRQIEYFDPDTLFNNTAIDSNIKAILESLKNKETFQIPIKLSIDLAFPSEPFYKQENHSIHFANDYYNIQQDNLPILSSIRKRPSSIQEENSERENDSAIDSPLKQTSNFKYIDYKEKAELSGHNDHVVTIIQLEDGTLASGSYDNTVKIWSLKTFEEIKSFTEFDNILSLLQMEPDSIIVSVKQKQINSWNISSRIPEKKTEYYGHSLWINCLVKLDKNTFASGSNDRTIMIWELNNINYKNKIDAHDDCILAMIKLKNGKLCSGGADNVIKIWDWNKGNCICYFEAGKKWVKCLCELNNGYLLSGSGDKMLFGWKNNKKIHQEKAHNKCVRTICQLNDNLFCTGSFDSTIKIWDSNNFQMYQEIKGHEKNVIGIILLKNGNFASCSNDCKIKIWGI